jgi:cell division initiation protein
LLAQTTADQVKENSKKEIEMLMRDANENAANILKKAEDRSMDLNKEYEKLKQDYELFKTRFIAMLEAQVDSMNKASINL